LKVFTMAAGTLLYSALRIGVKHGTRRIARVKASVSCIVKQLPSLASDSTGCGAARVRERRSTASSIRSRTATPPMPRGLAVQARTSRYVEHVGGPAPVRRRHRDCTIVRPLATASGVGRQQQTCSPHNRITR
jgi:hypothetical protein